MPGKLRRVALLGDPTWRHADSITYVGALAGGKCVLTAARDGSARLWDLATGVELRRYNLPRGESIWHAAMLPGGPTAPAGREFLTAGDGDGVLRWRLDASEPVAVYKQEDMVFRVAVDKGGTRLVTGGEKERCVLLDVKTGTQIQRFTGHKESIYTVLFSRDDKKVLTGSADGTIRFWDPATGKELQKVSNATKGVYTMAPDPGGTRILVCCDSKSVWLMDADSGKEIWAAKLPKSVYCGAWSPDASLVAASCGDGRLYLLDAATGRQKWSAAMPGSTNYGVAFTADGREVLCACRCLLCRFDAGTGARIFPKPDGAVQCSPVSGLAPAPQAGTVLRVDGGRSVDALDRRTGACRKSWALPEDLRAVAVSPDSTKALVAGSEANAWLLDAPTGQVLHRLGHGGGVSDVAFSADGDLAITAGSAAGGEAGIYLWRVATGKVFRQLSGTGRVEAMCVGPAGRLAAICQQGMLRVWALSTGRLLREIKLGDRGAVQCAFGARDEHWLLLRDKTGLSLWTSARQDTVAVTDAEVARLITRLGSDKYKEREAATETLIRGGEGVLAALEAVRTSDAEVQVRIAHIQETVLASGNAYQERGMTPLAEGESKSFTLHPDGRHWAALEGERSKTRIVIGRIEDDKLKPLRRIEDANVPCVLLFGADGQLYAGSRNGTISVYSCEE